VELKLQPRDAHLVLSHPDIFETVAEDNMDVINMPDEHLYLCGYVPDLIGCFILHKLNGICADCHVQVLPEYRKQYAEEFGQKVIEWTWDNTQLQKLVAQIPFLYPNVRDFAVKMGFKVEGTNKASFMKDGMIHSQWYLGLIR